MVEAATGAARGTDAGGPIATTVVEALRHSRIILPPVAKIEHAPACRPPLASASGGDAVGMVGT